MHKPWQYKQQKEKNHWSELNIKDEQINFSTHVGRLAFFMFSAATRLNIHSFFWLSDPVSIVHWEYPVSIVQSFLKFILIFLFPRKEQVKNDLLEKSSRWFCWNSYYSIETQQKCEDFYSVFFPCCSLNSVLKWRHRSCLLVGIRSQGYIELHFSFWCLGIYLSQESLNHEKGKGTYLEGIPTCHNRVNLGQWSPGTLCPHPAHSHLCPTSLNVTAMPDFSWCLYN